MQTYESSSANTTKCWLRNYETFDAKLRSSQREATIDVILTAMTGFLKRNVTPFATQVLNAFPAVVIQGARQVGKSTLAAILAEGADSRVLTLDDDETRAAALEDPRLFVEQHPRGLLVIDEIQRAPSLILAIKAAIDRERRPGRFLITGSSNLLRLERTPDSLAGRAVTVPLGVLTQGELTGTTDDFAARVRQGVDVHAIRSTTTRADYAALLAAGGYPEAQALKGRLRSTWLDAYVERIVQRDASDVVPTIDSARLASVLRLLAANQSGELVKARIAQDAAIPATSITGYLDVLESLFLSERVPPWTPNLTSREAAKPKSVVNDSGLATRLGRVTEQQMLALPSGPHHFGPFLEGFVVGELHRQRSWSTEEYELFHYRTRVGLEVDVILEFSDGTVLAIDVKSGTTFRPEHFAALRVLRDSLGDRFVGGIVLNTGTAGYSFASKLWGLPVAALWEL